MKMQNMIFYVKPWNKSYPINAETIEMFAYAKVACINLSMNRAEITFKGIGTYVKDKF